MKFRKDSTPLLCIADRFGVATQPIQPSFFFSCDFEWFFPGLNWILKSVLSIFCAVLGLNWGREWMMPVLFFYWFFSPAQHKKTHSKTSLIRWMAWYCADCNVCLTCACRSSRCIAFTFWKCYSSSIALNIFTICAHCSSIVRDRYLKTPWVLECMFMFSRVSIVVFCSNEIRKQKIIRQTPRDFNSSYLLLAPTGEFLNSVCPLDAVHVRGSEPEAFGCISNSANSNRSQFASISTVLFFQRCGA